MDFVELARQAWDAGDFDKARMFYQKASYGIHDTDQANKDALGLFACIIAYAVQSF